MNRRIVWSGGALLLLVCALIGLTRGAGATSPAPTGSGPHGLLTATATPLAATPTSTPCTITFTDVDPSNPFYTFIRCLACRGIISGYPDGTYRWGNLMTRGQMAKLIALAAGFSDAIPTTRQTFADVPLNNLYWLWAELCAAHNIFAGYTCGGTGEPCDPQQRPYLRLYNTLTRGQSAKVLSNAANYQDVIPSTQQTYVDVPPTHPFWIFVERLVLHAIISPCQLPPCTFGPEHDLTRGQMAKIIANAYYPNCQTPSR